MRRSLAGWIAGICLWVAWAPAGAWTAEPAAVPVQTALLVDQAAILDSQADARLEAKLQAIQESGRAQVAILISNGIGDETLAAYSLRVAEAWRLGRATRDDGLLILVVPSRQAARLEVGYGLEGIIPDARASQWNAELSAAMKSRQLAAGLDHLLDEVDAILPAAVARPDKIGELIAAHPEWKLPFIVMVFSPLAMFPMLLGGLMSFDSFSSAVRPPKKAFSWSNVLSALLLAAFAGIAAAMLWGARMPAFIAAGVAFTLPLLWGLNFCEHDRLARALQYAKVVGNLMAVALFFSVITLAVGTGLYVAGEPHVEATPLFASLLALGLAVYLFPRRARVLMLALRSYVHFLLMAMVVYGAMLEFNSQPGVIAFSVAGIFTALVALAIYLEDRENARAESAVKPMRWSLWLKGLVILMVLPFGILLLMQGAAGEDFHTRLMQAAAGGGSIAGVLWWAAGVGLVTSIRVGLGGLFGGGGAGR